MKKIFTLFALTALFATGLNAQYYYVPFPLIGQNPGNLNTDVELPVASLIGWTTLQTQSATPVWSPAQSIPFTFSFNGTPETQFKVSTSGILTFDVGTALAAPTYTKAALPSALIPDKSVCIWGLTALGPNDYIITKIFGTSPNQQMWIQFNSYGYGTVASGNLDYTYWGIVLEETTNNIYIVDQRTGGFASTKKVSAGIQIDASTAVSIAGSPDLVSLANTDNTPGNNSYYQFIQGTQAAFDAALSDLTPSISSAASYTLVGAVNTISCTIKNLGTSPITTLDFKYSDGTNTYTDTKTGLNIPTFGTSVLSHATTYTTATLGAHPLTVWVELSGDSNNSNDSSNTTIQGVSFFPVHAVVFEEATGTWCGWCPRGTVYMDSMANVHGGETVLIAVHNSDPMVVADYDAGVATSISGYPSVLVNRNIVDDPSNMFTLFDDHINDFGFGTVTPVTTYNFLTNSFDITVNASFAAELNGDYRIAVVVTEDKMKGTTTDWDQANYYSFQTNNLALVGGGHDWQAETDPVPAANMEYNHVARVILGGYLGEVGSLPAAILAGSNHSYSFTYPIPSDMNINNTHINALLIDANNNTILNGASGTFTLGVKENDALIGNFGVYPNPVTDNATISYSLKKQNNVSISVSNILGEVAYTNDLGNQGAGAYKLDVNSTSLKNGLYFVTLVVGDNKYTEKISVNN